MAARDCHNNVFSLKETYRKSRPDSSRVLLFITSSQKEREVHKKFCKIFGLKFLPLRQRSSGSQPHRHLELAACIIISRVCHYSYEVVSGFFLERMCLSSSWLYFRSLERLVFVGVTAQEEVSPRDIRQERWEKIERKWQVRQQVMIIIIETMNESRVETTVEKCLMMLEVEVTRKTFLRADHHLFLLSMKNQMRLRREAAQEFRQKEWTFFSFFGCSSPLSLTKRKRRSCIDSVPTKTK